MSNVDAFWLIIAGSYTEEELRTLDRLWCELRTWAPPSSIPGVVERVKRWTER